MSNAGLPTHTCCTHCSASFQELGRRLKKTNPVVAEIFTLMSRDEARHAGFLNKVRKDILPFLHV